MDRIKTLTKRWGVLKTLRAQGPWFARIMLVNQSNLATDQWSEFPGQKPNAELVGIRHNADNC